MSFLAPATTFNFVVTMWDAPGTGSLAGNLLKVAGQLLLGGFSEVQGLDADLELETYVEGGFAHRPLKLLKGARTSNLVFRRGVTWSTDIAAWHHAVLMGKDRVTRKDGLVMLMDRNGMGGLSSTPVVGGLLRLPIAAWRFQGGLPERYHGPQLNAKGNEIAIETLEISHQGLERLTPSMLPGVAGAAAGAIGL